MRYAPLAGGVRPRRRLPQPQNMRADAVAERLRRAGPKGRTDWHIVQRCGIAITRPAATVRGGAAGSHRREIAITAAETFHMLGSKSIVAANGRYSSHLAPRSTSRPVVIAIPQHRNVTLRRFDPSRHHVAHHPKPHTRK